MNNLKIKINGTEISLENSNPTSGSLAVKNDDYDALYAAISKESDALARQIKACALLADIKTVESFGYKSTEGVGQNIKGAASKIGQQIIKILQKIGLFFKKLGAHISSIFIKQKVQKIHDQPTKAKFETVCGKIVSCLKKYDDECTAKIRAVQKTVQAANDEATKNLSPNATEAEKQRAAIATKANNVINKYCTLILQTQNVAKDIVKDNVQQLHDRVLKAANSVLDTTDKIMSEAIKTAPGATMEQIDKAFAPLHQSLDAALQEAEQYSKEAANVAQSTAPTGNKPNA